MNQQFRDFQELMNGANDFMGTKLFYSPKTPTIYKAGWRRIRLFMHQNKLKKYDLEVETLFLTQLLECRTKKELSTLERYRYNAAKMLTQFQQTGRIDPPLYRANRPMANQIVYTGAVGQVITQFLVYLKTEGRSSDSIRSYKRYLGQFFQYCQKKEVKAIDEIDLTFILQYLNDLDSSKKTLVQAVLWTLRNFMKYLFLQGLTLVNYGEKIPKYKAVNQPKLPSTYSKEEIEKLISTIRRDSPMGKRNYAIVLLAARLGLRASDISRLKFEHLNWDTNQIRLKQVKTDKELVLPLLADIGNAIIDYLKYGRPPSQTPFVFLTGRPPCGPFPNSNVVTHIVQRAFRKSGINIKGRKFGPHSLRHSLSSRLLEERIVLPVITEVLGHQNTNSTKYYLRIDLASMQQCVLDVPAVSINFYQQKAGIFYE